MIDVRLFATLREGRQKKYDLDAGRFRTAADILTELDIPASEVAILLINGFHSKPEDTVRDGDMISVFPPVAGG